MNRNTNSKTETQTLVMELRSLPNGDFRLEETEELRTPTALAVTSMRGTLEMFADRVISYGDAETAVVVETFGHYERTYFFFNVAEGQGS